MPSGKRGIALLGSTGSIGTQTLEVISTFPELFDLQAITAGSNANLLIEQAIKYHPNMVVIADESAYKKIKEQKHILKEAVIDYFLGNEYVSEEMLLTSD